VFWSTRAKSESLLIIVFERRGRCDALNEEVNDEVELSDSSLSSSMLGFGDVKETAEDEELLRNSRCILLKESSALDKDVEGEQTSSAYMHKTIFVRRLRFRYKTIYIVKILIWVASDFA